MGDNQHCLNMDARAAKTKVLPQKQKPKEVRKKR